MSYSFQETKDILNGIGEGFCAAKWTQVTMHLHNGLTHSCHHPKPHKVPLSEIETNPSALHNTVHKKLNRKSMLDGKKPSECEYCWKIEKNSNIYSDRVLKSSEPWSQPFIDEIKNKNWEDNYNPKYVEVSFSNICNFKCAYCGPMFSSKWVEEIEKYGPYVESNYFNSIEWLEKNNTLPYKHSEVNPYVESFWKWWPDLYRDLHTFRITGGEPLLSKDTWKVLDYILEEENPNKNLNLSINSNLGVPDELIDKLIDKLKRIIDEERINEVVIFSSIDGYGEQAEYLRNGLNNTKFWENVEKILDNLPKVTVTLMSTYNILSPFSYNDLIKKVYDLKLKYTNKERYWQHPIILDTSYLNHPTHLSVKLLSDEHKKLVLDNAETALYYSVSVFNNIHMGMTEIEVGKIKRIYDWLISDDFQFNIEKERKCFVNFVDELDRRRKTNFIETFPELTEFYNKIKNDI